MKGIPAGHVSKDVGGGEGGGGGGEGGGGGGGGGAGGGASGSMHGPVTPSPHMTPLATMYARQHWLASCRLHCA